MSLPNEFTVRITSNMKLKTGDKSFKTEKKFKDYNLAYQYYRDTGRSLADRTKHEMLVELINPFKVCILSTYVSPKKEQTAPAKKRSSRTFQRIDEQEIRALILLFQVTKELMSKKYENAQIVQAFSRCIEFMDAISPKLQKAVENKDPIVQLTYLE